MLNNLSKKVAALVLVAGIIAIAIGGVFVSQGFSKANYITEQIAAQQITYGGAGSTIDGIIDTPQEAQEMASVLQEHQLALGVYSQLSRDDPNRAQILNALTMENALNLAVAGYGLTDVVKASGAFMILVGLTFGAIAVSTLRKAKQT